MVAWTTTTQASSTNGVKAIIYGRSGMGKTMLAATAPGPIILSAESGLLSLNKANIERIHGVGTPGICYDIPVAQIRTVDDLTEMYNWCVGNPNAYGTVVTDSITEIGEVVLANAKKQVKDPRQAYGELIEKMLMVIKSFRDLPGKNVVMLAKEELTKDDTTGRTSYGPSMPGSKLGPQLPYYFDAVLRLGVNKDPASGTEYRFLQTQPDFQYDAKDRSGRLAPVEYPHLGSIFSKILGA